MNNAHPTASKKFVLAFAKQTRLLCRYCWLIYWNVIGEIEFLHGFVQHGIEKIGVGCRYFVVVAIPSAVTAGEPGKQFV